MQEGPAVDDEDLKRRLDALGTSVSVSSKIARLRALYDHIDGALRRGATRQDVLDVLNADGFDMTMASFKSALQRIRSERKGRHADAVTDTSPDSSADTSRSDAGAAGDKSGVNPAIKEGPFSEAMADLFARRELRHWDGRAYSRTLNEVAGRHVREPQDLRVRTAVALD
jgi:hypothetical protein